MISPVRRSGQPYGSFPFSVNGFVIVPRRETAHQQYETDRTEKHVPGEDAQPTESDPQ
jgi:hypothetical protein